MKVFVPHMETKNIYFDEIIRFSKCEFVFGNWNEYQSSFEIVNIQFPEALFDWKVPTHQQLFELEVKIVLWKKHSKLVYTMNDFKTHYDEDENFAALFALIHKYSDGVIHLGNFSLKKYSTYFSQKCIHRVIYHPLYSSLIENSDVENIQNIIPIDLTNKYLVSVVGVIRSKEELDLILKLFRNLRQKNKFLIIPRLHNIINVPEYIPYRLRKKYRILMERIYFIRFSSQQYFVDYKFWEYSYIIDLMNKSSLLIVPRLRNLNSGNLFLGLTFDKTMVLPRVGNLTEVIELFGLPSFDPNDVNFKQISKLIIEFEQKSKMASEEYCNLKNLFHPQNIAKQYDDFFNSISVFHTV